MTLLWMDGFDHYNTGAMLADKGYIINMASGNYYVGASYARLDGNGLQTNYTGYYFRRILPGDTYATMYAGVAMRVITATTPSPSATYPFLAFLDGSGVIQVGLALTADYGISAYNGDGTLLGTSSNNVFPFNEWRYIEAKVTISDSGGVVEVRINGAVVLNLTSQDTKNGTDYIKYIQFSTFRHHLSTQFDDIYIDDAQFHGNCHITAFMPDSDSATNTDFVRSGGSNDYECVDENPPNNDTDYIKSSTVGHKSTFGITTGSLNTVEGIQVNNRVKAATAGNRKGKPLVRSNGADYQGAESDFLDNEYKNSIYGPWETDPDDSNPWTQTKLEAAEFGLEITD
jgi:hypothetical protein